jgi:hypothetical protein
MSLSPAPADPAVAEGLQHSSCIARERRFYSEGSWLPSEPKSGQSSGGQEVGFWATSFGFGSGVLGPMRGRGGRVIGEDHVEMGALVVAGGNVSSAVDGPGLWTPSWPVLGKTVLQRWIERVQGLGVGLVSVVDRNTHESNRVHTMVEWAKEGVEQILLIVLGSYAEIDLLDLIRFHSEGQRQVTKVFDQQGPLGISVLDRGCILANREQASQDGDLPSSRYDFLGYVVRLSSTANYRRLVEDALQGRCGIQPKGFQNRPSVWIDETAQVDASAQIQGPCYIGPATKVRAGVALRGCSSVERNCDIDLGTTLDHTSIQPNTYVAPGLYFRESVVDGTRLEHLARGVAVDLGTAGLSARIGTRAKRVHRSPTLARVSEFSAPDAKAG